MTVMRILEETGLKEAQAVLTEGGGAAVTAESSDCQDDKQGA